MGQTLTNGIFLPNEGERNCYTGLAGNWRAIDGYIGDYNVHVADAVIHVSQADRDKWDAVDNKADASALTAHTGNTTIHVTAADKTKWDAVTTKANDADVMHKAGNETIPGVKTFSSTPYIYNSDISSGTPNINLRNSKVTKGTTTDNGSQIIQFLDKDLKYLAQVIGNKLSNGSSAIKFNVSTLDSNAQSVNAEVQLYITVNGEKSFIPSNDNDVALGRPQNRWKDVNTLLFNGLTPSSLSMPTDNFANIIDISGYLTVLDGSQANTYRAPANGWIAITMNGCSGMQAYITGLWGHQIIRPTVGGVRFLMPICKNTTATILIFGGIIANARFIPCQGNI